MATVQVIDDIKVVHIDYEMKATNKTGQWYTDTDKADRLTAVSICKDALIEISDNHYRNMHTRDKVFGWSAQYKRWNTATEVLEGFIFNHTQKIGKSGKGQYDLSEKQFDPITAALCEVIAAIGVQNTAVIKWNKK
jgi:hypothetical protein